MKVYHRGSQKPEVGLDSVCGPGPGGTRLVRFLQYEVREGREAREAGDASERFLLQIAMILSLCSGEV